jgi:ribonucleotide reductase alpha subunit
MGIMGWADMLYHSRPIMSIEAVELAEQVMEFIDSKQKP